MLDYRVLTFLTLYEEMNYRKTAEKRNMTQPGVTQHIHYLEDYYGVRLFRYDGRSLMRTKQAERLKRYFDGVRAEEIALREEFALPDGTHLRVGATKTIGEFVIAPCIGRFLARERCSLDLIVDNTENLLNMLSRGELDFAVIEGVFNKEEHPFRPFKKERFLGICGKTHLFAGKTVSLEQVLRENLIVREKGSGTRMLLQRAVEEKGYSLDSFRSCSSISNFSVICETIAQSEAVTFAYEPISRCRADLATFLVEDMAIQGEFNFVYANEEVANEKIGILFDGERFGG